MAIWIYSRNFQLTHGLFTKQFINYLACRTRCMIISNAASCSLFPMLAGVWINQRFLYYRVPSGLFSVEGSYWVSPNQLFLSSGFLCGEQSKTPVFLSKLERMKLKSSCSLFPSIGLANSIFQFLDRSPNKVLLASVLLQRFPLV